MNKYLKTSLAAVFLTGALGGCSDQPETEYLSFNEFLDLVEQGEVQEIEVTQDSYSSKETIYWPPRHPDDEEAEETAAEKTAPEQSEEPETQYVIGVPNNENLYDRLEPYDVEVTVDREGGDFTAWDILFPLVLFGGIGALILGPLWGPQLKMALSARSQKNKKPDVTFDDIAGVDEAIDEVQDILDFLDDPQKYREKGLKPPKGLLLTGPPGNGKTLLAKAIAGETGANFISYPGSEFGSSKWMGAGTGMVKAAFRNARKQSPCVLFIDEIDSVGRKRSGGDGSGSGVPSEGAAVMDRENTLNQLLVELDGFDSGKHDVILIAATNRPDMLDPALTRPGRIDRQAVIGKPDIKSRERILKIYLDRHDCEPDVNPAELAKVTYNFSGAELANLVKEAAILAFRADREKINKHDVEAAKDKVLLGAEFKSRQFSEEERNTTAFHEAGHAIAGHLLPHSFPVYKATIVPRGKSLGVVMRAPQSDVSSQSLAGLKADLAVAMAGRIAEELVFGKENITTGAANDFQQANTMAKAMVRQYGMSGSLTPYFLENNGYGLTSEVSPDTLAAIDSEVGQLLKEAGETARTIICENWDNFVTLADTLLERETLDADEIAEILGPNADRGMIEPNRTAPALR